MSYEKGMYELKHWHDQGHKQQKLTRIISTNKEGKIIFKRKYYSTCTGNLRPRVAEVVSFSKKQHYKDINDLQT